MALQEVTVPYRRNYDYGIGADLASGSALNKVVTGDVSGIEGAPGATTQFEITRIRTTSDLETILGIDAEANYGCGLFGSVHARFKFAKRSQVQSSSLFMSITANVGLEYKSIDEPFLTDPASQIVNRPDVFSTRYGNMFVRGIQRGGLFVATMRIDTSSSEASEAISGELGGSYGLFSAEAKTKLENLQRDYRNEITIVVHHEGGPIDLIPDSLDDPLQLYELLQAWLKAFQDEPEENAVPYYVTLSPIAIANGPTPPNVVDIQHAQDILVLCAKQRSAILDKLNLMDYIAQNPSRYDFPEPTTLADIVKASASYQADLDLVAATASQAINDVTKAVTPAEYALQVGKPYPLGMQPTPIPTLKPGLPPPPPVLEVVPNVIDLSQGDAVIQLQQKGFSVEISSLPSDDQNIDKVVDQDPDAGVALPIHSQVRIYLGTGGIQPAPPFDFDLPIHI